LQDCFGTWRGFAEVIAGLEGYVHRRATGAIARRFQRNNLGVGIAVARVESLPDDDAVANDNSADHWVRRCLTPALFGQG
jgi:hypothetical protein